MDKPSKIIVLSHSVKPEDTKEEKRFKRMMEDFNHFAERSEEPYL